MYTRSLICYTGNNLALCLNTTPVAGGDTSKTVCETASLASILYLGLRLLIIHGYLQRLHWAKYVKMIVAWIKQIKYVY